MTNEEKAKEVAMVWRAYGFPYETIYKIVLETMQWKDEQFKEMLQSLPQAVKDLIETLSK